MPYSATAFSVLISAPGDVEERDVDAAIAAINRWSNVYGRPLSAVAVPAHWQSHAAAEHGVRPQASLNSQLVEPADVVLALFWHRLGTDTGEAESGTVEEINEAAERGAYVAVFRCLRPYPHDSLDPDQLAHLEEYLHGLRRESLVMDYETSDQLAQRIDTTLAVAITESRTEARVAARVHGADVWPRVERIGKEAKLVLANSGDEPARNVRFRLEQQEGIEGDLPLRSDENPPLEVLAPNGGTTSYPLFLHLGIADQARCVVTWEDSAGTHENTVSVRFF